MVMSLTEKCITHENIYVIRSFCVLKNKNMAKKWEQGKMTAVHFGFSPALSSCLSILSKLNYFLKQRQLKEPSTTGKIWTVHTEAPF